MVKYIYLLLFLSISMLRVFSQAVDINYLSQDTCDCSERYFNMYVKGMEDNIVTYWSVPPKIKKTSIEYVNLICEQISQSDCEDKNVSVLLLVDEFGVPYCSTIIDLISTLKKQYRDEILTFSSQLRFYPAKIGERNVESFYFLIARKKKNGKWFYPEMQ